MNDCDVEAEVLLVFSTGELGGAERSLTRMSQMKSGVRYRLATLGSCGSWCDYMATLGVEPLFSSPPTSAIPRLRCLLASMRTIRNGGFDFIYAIGNRASLVSRASLAFKRRARPQLVIGTRWNPSGRSRGAILTRLIYRILAPATSIWVSNSSAAAQTLRTVIPSRSKDIRVIHNGVPRPRIMPKPPSQRRLQVVTVANIQERKGIIEYVDDVMRVSSVLPDYKFMILGQDRMNGLLERTIAAAGLERVMHACGFIDDVYPWLLESRLFVLPSRFGEGAPTSILESLSCGTPVVGYDIDGSLELVRDKQDGYLVSVHSEGLSDAMIRALSNPRKLDQMSASCLQSASDRFSLSTCTAKHSEMFALNSNR